MSAILTTIEKLKLNTKLTFGFSSGLLIAAAIGYFSLYSLEKAQAEMERLYDKELLGISHMKEANINLVYMGRAMRQALIAQDDVARDKARTQIAEAREKLRLELAEGRKRLIREENIRLHDQFLRHFTQFNENVEHALAMIEREKSNPSEAAKFIGSANFNAAVNAADDTLTEITRVKERGAQSGIEIARQRAENTRWYAISLLLLGMVFSLGFGVLIGRSIQYPNKRLLNSVENLAEGDVGSPIPHTDYPNEIGVMARAISVLQDIYRQANTQHWVKSNVTDISAALQQCEDMRSLTQTAVSKVAAAIGGGHGALYVLDAENRYSLLASYGYRERKHLSNSFAIGEGLVGQCVMERSPISLSAPQNYIRINSGLGDGPPACISVMPVIMGERVLGVLEMASFQIFSEREQALLDALLPVLATSLEILDRNLKTRELLLATQEQAERMEKQAAQLEEQTVEMEAQQAELLETENWFRSIIENAPDGMLVADTTGRILLTNPMVEKIFGYAPGELVGGQIEQLVPATERSGHAEKRAHFLAAGQSRSMGNSSRLAGIRKDGREVEVHVTLSPLPERGGRGKCVSASVRAV